MRRHAPGARAEVLLRYGDSAVAVHIRDWGPGPAATSRDGHGLPGMAERAAMAGGTLQASPAAGGGFLVTAELPVTGRVS